MDTAKQANAFITKALAVLTDENDIKQYGNLPEIFNNAAVGFFKAHKNVKQGGFTGFWLGYNHSSLAFTDWRY